MFRHRWPGRRWSCYGQGVIAWGDTPLAAWQEWDMRVRWIESLACAHAAVAVAAA